MSTSMDLTPQISHQGRPPGRKKGSSNLSRTFIEVIALETLNTYFIFKFFCEKYVDRASNLNTKLKNILKIWKLSFYKQLFNIAHFKFPSLILFIFRSYYFYKIMQVYCDV